MSYGQFASRLADRQRAIEEKDQEVTAGEEDKENLGKAVPKLLKWSLGHRKFHFSKHNPGWIKEDAETPTKVFPDDPAPDSRQIGKSKTFAGYTKMRYCGASSEGNRYIGNEDL
eukprot:TRINITY_DN61_c3_g1_i1.p1 TRINITY_DN61_c3_g1~~TRINITY_DN61_c3_g1_i1.p1  ORF type:complete len:114 (-),score=37.92 TRINITY_DN61_c3_g1_i1:195-536(-)